MLIPVYMFMLSTQVYNISH